jgi:putative hemolysin
MASLLCQNLPWFQPRKPASGRKQKKEIQGQIPHSSSQMNPTAFLSTIQIGITLVGIFAGAFGGATIAEELSSYLREIPALAPYSNALSITLVVLVITYLTLIFGELFPKRLALNNADAIASNVAKPMFFLSLIAKPLVFILSYSTEAVLRLMRVRKIAGPPVTEEEIKIMLEEGTEAGVFEKAELSMIEGVFDIGDRRVESLIYVHLAADC